MWKKLLALSAFGIVVAGILAQTGALRALFSSSYVPHRYCYLAQPGLVWTNVVMDGLIGLSYALIFGALFWIANRLRRVPDLRGYLWIFISFGIFIAACGATHFMEIVTIWIPVYPLSATVKVLCAAASVPTAILFTRAAPALADAIRSFLSMLSTTRSEKEQAISALAASEKLAVAGRISASITHEIKNPLDTIGNLLYLMAGDERLPADVIRMIGTAASELDRASTVARNTLAIYHQSSEPVPVSLSELMEGVLDLQQPAFLRSHIELDRCLHTPIDLKAYPGELRQIVINLLQNAAAAVGSDGRIIIRIQPRLLIAADRPAYGLRLSAAGVAHRERPGYSITVADNGPGIPPADRSRIFTLFFSTKGEQGTGLGLWLVRSMVEKHGGRIVFRSRTASECYRSGTVFNVWIPLEAPPVSAPAEAAVLTSAS
jgi:signal transduction histidine kinase